MGARPTQTEPDRTPYGRGAPLRGAWALVTGAASGIGRQVARDLFLREGCHVRMLDVDGPGLRAAGEALAPWSTPGQSLATHTIDLADGAAVRRLAESLAGTPLDVLVNVAGVLCVGPFERTPVETLEHVVHVNLLGPLRLTRALLPLLRRSRRAAVVNVASAAGLVGGPSLASYTASKFGLVGLSEALRVELHPDVTVVTVCPTLVRSELVAHARMGVNDPAAPAAETRGALHRILTRLGASPEKVSRAVVRGLAARRGLVLVNPDAHALYHLHRLLPGLTERVVRLGYRHLIRRGVLPP